MCRFNIPDNIPVLPEYEHKGNCGEVGEVGKLCLPSDPIAGNKKAIQSSYDKESNVPTRITTCLPGEIVATPFTL